MTVLLTGGSACGKSTYAETLAARRPGPRYYIAAMRPYGEESLAKIERHRRLRAGKGFIAVERYTALDGLVLPARGTALLECICNLTANEMFGGRGYFRDPFDDIIRGIEALRAQCDTLIVVTNDVGSGGGDYGEGTLRYIGTLGRINSALASRFDHVLELVSGIPIPLKGDLP